MNYEKYHQDEHRGMEFLMNRVEWLVGWIIFIVFLPVSYPLSKLGQYAQRREERLETYYRDTYGR